MRFRYVWVNEKTEPMTVFCAYDHVQITDGYVRELAAGLLYHDAYCLGQHTFACQEVVAQAKAS